VHLARNPEVIWRSTSRGPVLLAPTWGEARLLGGAAALVWEVLDEPLTDDALALAVAPLGSAGGTVAAAVEELEAGGLVVRRS
jgi:hypothetical protein